MSGSKMAQTADAENNLCMRTRCRPNKHSSGMEIEMESTMIASNAPLDPVAKAAPTSKQNAAHSERT